MTSILFGLGFLLFTFGYLVLAVTPVISEDNKDKSVLLGVWSLVIGMGSMWVAAGVAVIKWLG